MAGQTDGQRSREWDYLTLLDEPPDAQRPFICRRLGERCLCHALGDEDAPGAEGKALATL